MDSGVPNSPSPLSHRALTSMDTSSRRSYAHDSDNTPQDRAKLWRPHPQYLFPKSLRKVQVVYYLARISGRLEHPHYIELTLPLNQPLRLKERFQVEEVHVSKRHSFHQVQTPNRSSSRRSLRSSPLTEPEAEFQEEEYEEAEKRSFASSTESNGLAVARSRRWVLLQLMACGTSAMSKANKREISTVETEKEVVKTTEMTEEETVGERGLRIQMTVTACMEYSVREEDKTLCCSSPNYSSLFKTMRNKLGDVASWSNKLDDMARGSVL